MILFDGKTYESSEQDRLLTELENKKKRRRAFRIKERAVVS